MEISGCFLFLGISVMDDLHFRGALGSRFSDTHASLILKRVSVTRSGIRAATWPYRESTSDTCVKARSTFNVFERRLGGSR